MTFIEYVVAHVGESITEDQRKVLEKYEARQLGNTELRLSVIPGGKADAWLKEQWDEYLKHQEKTFENVREHEEGKCYACGAHESSDTCNECGHEHCQFCTSPCSICGEGFCEGCMNEHGCEAYLG